MSADRSTPRRFGDRLIVDQAQQQVQTFFDELKNGTRNYRTITSLSSQITQEYRGRCILELLQNAHDALANAEPDDQRRISFVLSTTPDPVLLIGNSGRPFRTEDFDGICQLGQSPKDPNTSVGNKGLGFRSVLEVSTCPEVWSTAPAGSDTSFVFYFDPSVSDRVAASAQEIEQQGLGARSPFGAERPLVDWSREQLDQYRKKVSDAGLDIVREIELLSPYLFPLPIKGMLPEVKKLLDAGHTTVIRLRLDGGKAGACENAVQSVRGQLQELNAKSTIFLSYLEALVIDVDGERCILERAVDSNVKLPGCQRTRQQQLLVGRSGPVPDDNTTRQFHVWIHDLGGDDDPEQAERISAVVEHLPNRWPEVRQVSVGVAVEDAPILDKGAFVIFLPTEMTTGTGAYVNAPFYGSLDRRKINFKEPYNELLLDSVLDLCLDVIAGLTSEQPEDWRAWAVIDLLSSTEKVGGQDRRFMDRLHERASEQDSGLDNQALVLCDDGWCIPPRARMMPNIPDDNPISAERWRKHAKFDVVSRVLDGRRDAVKVLLTEFYGSPDPTHQEWRQTIERMATQVQARNIDVTWNGFLDSLVSVLPWDLQSEPTAGALDLLASMRFLPTQDGRLLSAADSAKLFFQPVRGVDDVANLIGEVPGSLKPQVAFLHPDVRTQKERQQHRNTPVQKFLDGRFVRSFRREEILRYVVIPALPPLPTPHGSPEAALCSELFCWTLKLLGTAEWDSLLPRLKRLPVACHGGWLAMSDAVFGPDWPDRHGDLVWSLADELPEDAAMQLKETTLLPPGDPRWGVAVEDRDQLFDRAGVASGLRLQRSPKISFEMSYGNHELPSKPPIATPQTAWDDWRNAVREAAKPPYSSPFEYDLDGIQLLPEIHYLTTLNQSGRKALSCLLLASLGHWPVGWELATIRKTRGESWSRKVDSPLKYWLTTLAWLNDKSNAEQPLRRRWLVPESLLRTQRDRYSHLDCLSPDLARRLNAEPVLEDTLTQFGLNVYPTREEDRTGPELLDALATAWTANRVPAGRFDVFLGQVRHAWQHLDPHRELPDTFLVTDGRRMFSPREGSELADVYLPNTRDRTRSLQEHGKHILEMRPADAIHMAETLLARTNVKRASKLDERFLIDGDLWTDVVNGLPPLNGTRYGWLPVTLLAIAAHGGARPAGATTKRWHEAADRLRRAHVLECETIAVQLVDGDQVVASSEPEAQWLPLSDVLAIQRDVGLSYECIASAAQAILGRQDLLKDLRLVLGALSDKEAPTREQIEEALERAEIDSHTLADVRRQWAGNISLAVDRIRPVLALLGISVDGLDTSATDMDRLTEWLSSNLQQWPSSDLLPAARRSLDDRSMGKEACRALGDVAELPAWNDALSKLGDQYLVVENRDTDEQTTNHLEEVALLLRGLARYVAIEAGNPELFLDLENVRNNFKAGDDWSTRWWEVPFSAVIDAIRDGYAEIPGTERHLEVLEGARTVDDLRTAFQRIGIAIDPDPYETAHANKRKLGELLRRVHDLRLGWMEFQTTSADPTAPVLLGPPTELHPVAYLRLWSDAEMLEQALIIIDDAEFVSACDGCTSLDEIRERLGLDAKIVDARRQERLQHDREEERQRRTFDVAGTPFEVGTADYGELFDRLNSLPDPEGPRASQDEFTPVSIPRQSRGL